jgi:hypothetical protein
MAAEAAPMNPTAEEPRDTMMSDVAEKPAAVAEPAQMDNPVGGEAPKADAVPVKHDASAPAPDSKPTEVALPADKPAIPPGPSGPAAPPPAPMPTRQYLEATGQL